MKRRLIDLVDATSRHSPGKPRPGAEGLPRSQGAFTLSRLIGECLVEYIEHPSQDVRGSILVAGDKALAPRGDAGVAVLGVGPNEGGKIGPLNVNVSSLPGSLISMTVILFPSGSLTHRISEGRLVLADQPSSRPRIVAPGRNIAQCVPKVTGLAYLYVVVWTISK